MDKFISVKTRKRKTANDCEHLQAFVAIPIYQRKFAFRLHSYTFDKINGRILHFSINRRVFANRVLFDKHLFDRYTEQFLLETCVYWVSSIRVVN